VLFAVLALVLTGLFSMLRAALLHSVPSRVLERARSEAARRVLRPLLERAEDLATSASVCAITSQIVFVVLVLVLVTRDTLTWTGTGIALALAVPLLVFASEILPSAVRGDRADALLRRTLPSFSKAQQPLAAVLYLLEATRRGTMHVLRIPHKSRSARRIVEDIRDVIEESERDSELQESEREIIENVVEFYDVDVAEVMTPRTELTAVEVSATVQELVRVFAESGHSRIPIYDGNLDTIIGVVYGRQILQLLSTDDLSAASLRTMARPISFVPETKLVSELLAQFRRDKQKMAIVLDEYGGTSGLVTIGDIVSEIVGDMRDEMGEGEPEPIQKLSLGSFWVQGNARVSEVNEELGLSLPEEEDFETVAGFVLSELGRFPKRGEHFEWDGIQFLVREANDRRVLAVELKLPAGQRSS
jgi:CBS domain containing-hemolysin-like protein